MIYLPAWLCAALMLIAVGVGTETGWYFGKRNQRRNVHLEKGVAGSEGLVFAMLGLLLAFSFSGAATRFEDRRHLIARESNALGTAWLRLGLLDARDQPEVRALFRQYVDARISSYDALPDLEAAQLRYRYAKSLQPAVWAAAQRSALRPEAAPGALVAVMPALNEVFDVELLREAATLNHPPTAIFILLFTLALFASILVGFRAAEADRRPWLHNLSLAILVALTTFVIFELEYPRRGLVRVDEMDRLINETREGMQ